ncbi:MAG: aldo/keto reductase [Rhodospirillaceae bacterium]|jgi:aryl-alcohol dehydrogenase-like predicted oxidoreductase|nr:aldo/keto reductase [Rhodospirillaceae bacterium]MBT3886069.1 aldo/keto reductase [Rhodospirillaceae bacterium]MBT4117008.1 aldo/keto reductase [Rhodospirillaceae bacterium]MBT4672233.1 aldo/keto reductase [Rhodospirillaceae bacterium]MBT4718338.1 aldo/keto reductase [Rhodospirillaceae bacterium]
MDYTTLGRTGLRVSVAGLGGGGDSRLGMTAGRNEAEVADTVKFALDLGINVIDCGYTYGTEDAVGRGLKNVDRDQVVLSSKYYVRQKGTFHKPGEVVAGLEESLRRLGTDHLDIFFLHGITPASYDYAVTEILPVIRREQEKGKFRFLGLTEAPPLDLNHEGLSLALDDDHFDVAMLAFSPTNQNARDIAFPRTMAQGWGTYVMYVGRFLSDAGRVRDTLAAMAEAHEFPAELGSRGNPLDFLMEEGGARDMMDAAYRYARHEPGANVVLFGSGDQAHIASNVKSINSPPLSDEVLTRLKALFGGRPGVGVQSAAIYRK